MAGTSGAGALVNEIFLARMAGALETIYFNDLDYIFSKVSFLARSPAESYTFNPMSDMLTSDQWDEVRTKDAWYRARIKDFFKACSLGGTPDGIRMCVTAALAVDCDIYEVWRYMDNFGLSEELGRSNVASPPEDAIGNLPNNGRNELVVQPLKGTLAPDELRLVRDMLAKICPLDTVVTVNLNGLAVQSPLTVNAAAADSTYYEVQKMVTATPALSQLPPPELLPIDLLPTEQWLYDAKTDPQLAPYTAFNISAEYGYYYLVGGGNRSPIDSVTYGIINPNPPTQITVFEVSGTYQVLEGVGVGVTSDTFYENNLDPTLFRWVPVPYPGDLYPLGASISAGVSSLVNLINSFPGPFVMVGYSQGSSVVSDVYDLIRGDQLQSRRADFLGGVVFGNPRRQAGHTFPGGPPALGHGIDAQNLLVNSETLWYDFTVPGDTTCTTDDSQAGRWDTEVFNLLVSNYTGVLTSIVELITSPIPNVEALIQGLLMAFYGLAAVGAPHSQYPIYQPLLAKGDTRSCVDIGKDFINSLAQTPNLKVKVPDYPICCYEVGGTAYVAGIAGIGLAEVDPTLITDKKFSSGRDAFGQLLDSRIKYMVLEYPAESYPMNWSVQAGVNNLVALINSNPGKFMMAGFSQGAMVTSMVLREILSGSLTHRQNDLVAAVTFGNPMREAGHLWPALTAAIEDINPNLDPGGHGIDGDRLSSTPDWWWDFCNPGDPAASTGDGLEGQWSTILFDLLQQNYTGDLLAVAALALLAPVNVPLVLSTLIQIFYGVVTEHVAYPYSTPLASLGDHRTSYQIAADYFNTFAAEATPYVDPPFDPMLTYRSENNYQTFDTTGQYTAPLPYAVADSPDNFPGGKYGIHPTVAPALNPDGTPYNFPWASQDAYVANQILEITFQGGLANETSYQLPLSAPSSSARVFYPNYAVAYYPPAKDSTVSASITRRHDSSTQISTEVRDPVNFVRQN
jgi:hypothetical protein